MTKLVTLNADASTATRSGSVSQFEDKSNSVSINGTRLATRADANIDINGNKFLPDKDKDSPSVTVNGSPVFLALDNVTTGSFSVTPTTEDINIDNGGANVTIDQA